MSLFKNKVGRPSNEIKKKRRIFVVSIIALAIIFISGVVLFVTHSVNVNTNLAAAALGNNSGDVWSPKDATKADGALTNGDAEAILKYSVGLVKFNLTQEKAADINKDGKITAEDARQVLRKVVKTSDFGDVNQDGKVTIFDAMDVLYVAGKIKKEATLKSKALADMDGDGKITAEDARLIWIKAMGYNKNFVAYNNRYKYGDVDLNGKVEVKDAQAILKHAKNTKKITNKTSLGIADIDGDKKISEKDSLIVLKVASLTYGDVNGDKKVDYNDAIKALRNAAGLEKLSSSKIKMADIDGDGKISTNEARILLRVSTTSDLPADVNGDGAITRADAELALEFAANLKTPTEAQKQAADLDNNGKITVADARRILNLVSNKIAK